jgi:hypothetical protein
MTDSIGYQLQADAVETVDTWAFDHPNSSLSIIRISPDGSYCAYGDDEGTITVSSCLEVLQAFLLCIFSRSGALHVLGIGCAQQMLEPLSVELSGTPARNAPSSSQLETAL